MPSLRSKIARRTIRSLLRPRLNPAHSPEVQRRFIRGIARIQRMPATVQVEECRFGAASGLLLRPEGARADRHVLYFHSGAYSVGSPGANAVGCAWLARAAGCPVFVPDYRLAPEHPYPAAPDDAERAWDGLCDSGLGAESIAVAGGSAGGGLALALALRLRDQQRPLPASLTLFAPWTDLALEGESIRRNRHSEPMLSREWLESCAGFYAAEHALKNPEISPLHADHKGLPAMQIQVGGDDLLLDDARRLHKAATASGVDARIDVFAEMFHEFQMMPDLVPEGARALTLAGAWIKAHFED